MLAALRWNSAPPRTRLAALSLPLVMLTTLVDLVIDGGAWVTVGHAALIVYIVAEWPRLPAVSRGVVVLALLSALVVLWRVPEPAAALVDGLARAAYFATFITALGFLREAASTSRLVHRCGRIIINQPPTKRYATLTVGSFLFGVILNLGVANLLGVMISSSNTLHAAGGEPAVRRARQRRMVSALLRGFAVTPLASPLSVTLAVLLSTMQGLYWYQLLPLGMVGAVLLLALGWWLDRRLAPRHLAAVAPVTDGRLEFGPVARFVALVLGIVGTAMVLHTLLEVRLFVAVLISAPPLALVWMAVQRRRVGSRRAMQYALLRLGRRAVHMFPGLRAEVGILGSAAFTGAMLTTLMPPGAVSELLAAAGLSGVGVAVAALVTIVAVAQVGINPIVSVTLLAAALSDPVQLGLAPPVLALAFMGGWALAINSSVLTAAVLLLARMSEVSPATVAYRWNGLYTLCGMLIMAALLLAADLAL